MLRPNDARTGELFTVSEVARHAGTTASTVKNWFCGDEIRGVPPLFAERPREPGAEIWLCFLELVEVIVARRFRGHGVSVDQLQRTRQHAREEWRVEFPLAERRLKLLGGRVLDAPGEAIDLDWPASQPALSGFAEFATEVFEYDADPVDIDAPAWAQRFFPAGVMAPLMVDPRFAGGAVTFLNRGLTLETIVGRWKAKESIAFIASDFGLDEPDVEAALRFALAS